MFRLLGAVCILVVIHNGTATPTRNGASQQVLDECRRTYTSELSNDFLIGEWFMVARYTLFGGFVPSASCSIYIIHKPTADNLTALETLYGEMLKQDDNPMLVNRPEFSVNLIVGNVEAKEYYGQPTGFAPYRSVQNYKRLSDDFVMVWDCALRGMTIDLHSRIRHPTNDQIALVTAGVSELSRLEFQRYCWVF